MICRIFSDLSTFKPIRFHCGLNLLVAEKTRTATDRQTRNGAGKSSLIELVHFALGADCGRGCIFRNQALSGYRFGIEMDIGESRVKVSRSGSRPSSVLSSGLDAGAGHGGETTQHSLLEEAGFEVKEWRDILGERFFGLPLADSRPRFAPTFRSLFPYFARRQASGGLGHPERHTRDQQLSDQQVAVSYLLGLDWDVPRQLQEVREKEKTIRQLRKGTRRAPSDASFHRPRSYGPTRPWPSAVSMR